MICPYFPSTPPFFMGFAMTIAHVFRKEKTDIPRRSLARGRII
jgi:hypothetical protein